MSPIRTLWRWLTNTSRRAELHDLAIPLLLTTPDASSGPLPRAAGLVCCLGCRVLHRRPSGECAACAGASCPAPMCGRAKAVGKPRCQACERDLEEKKRHRSRVAKVKRAAREAEKRRRSVVLTYDQRRKGTK